MMIVIQTTLVFKMTMVIFGVGDEKMMATMASKIVMRQKKKKKMSV